MNPEFRMRASPGSPVSRASAATHASRAGRVLASAAAVFALAVPAGMHAQSPERLDYQMLGRIREEGMQRSQVMDIISWLSDVKGPRLTGSPGFREAGDWTIETLKKWGMANVHYEPWAFGRGWSLERFSAHMIAPQIQPLIGYPKAWSPGTNGVVTGEVVQVLIATPADFEKYRGKLKGKIVLPQPERVVRMLEGNIVLKMKEQDIREAESTPIPGGAAGPRFTPPAGGRERPLLADTARGWRDDLRGERGEPGSQRGHAAAGDAGRRALQPDDPHPAEGGAGAGRTRPAGEVPRRRGDP